MEQVVEVNRVSDLENYRLVWQALLAKTKRATLFQSLDWLTLFWRHFGTDQRLRVLLVYRQGVPLGIVPLVVRREMTRVGRVRTLTYPLHDWGPFYGPISGEPASTLHAALRHIASTPRDWDLLDLRWINAQADLNHTPRAMQAAGFSPRPGLWQETAVIDLHESWDAYLASRTTNFRSDMRRRTRRIRALGNVTFERYRPRGTRYDESDPRLDVYDECVEVARRSWQGSSTTGTTLSHASVAAFFREMHVLSSELGTLDMALIRHNGRLIAFGYNIHRDGRLLGLRIGYDPEYRVGIGNYIYDMMLQDSFQRGDLEFDMGPGSFEAKKAWLTRVTPVLRYTHYALTSPRGQLLRWKHRWVGAASEKALREQVGGEPANW